MCRAQIGLRVSLPGLGVGEEGGEKGELGREGGVVCGEEGDGRPYGSQRGGLRFMEMDWGSCEWDE